MRTFDCGDNAFCFGKIVEGVNCFLIGRKLKTINLAYNFGSPCKGIENLTVFGTVNNVFTITGYSWYDPDVNTFGQDASRRGVDIYSYPASRTFSLGVKVTL